MDRWPRVNYNSRYVALLKGTDASLSAFIWRRKTQVCVQSTLGFRMWCTCCFWPIADSFHSVFQWCIEEETQGKPSEDAQTLDYLSITKLEPVSKAFDENASGIDSGHKVRRQRSLHDKEVSIQTLYVTQVAA